MAPRKKDVLSSIADTSKSSAKKAENTANRLREKAGKERIPAAARFLLVILINLCLSSALFTFTSNVTLAELGAVSKELDTWCDVGGLIVWKAVEVGIAWILGCNGQDALCFVFLTHLPTYAFLSAFHHLRPTTIMASYGIVFFSTAIPFALLRTPNSALSHTRTKSSGVRNRAILQDFAIKTYTTVLAAAIYTVVLYISYETWLPAQLVVHFEKLPDITKAHAGPAGLPMLFLTLLPAGLAARDFLFISSTSAPSAPTSEQKLVDAPDGEYLACTIYRKTWGRLSPKTKILTSRTVALAAMLVANTTVQIATTVNGADVVGAALWGSVWGVATSIVGMTYGWVENVDGV